jgi:striatin 1/3/4
MVKVWDVGGVGPGSLRLSWGYNGVGVDPASTSEETDVLGATVVEAIKTNLKCVAVGYRNATVKIFEVDSGKEVALLQADGVGEY